MIYLFYGPNAFSRNEALCALKEQVPAELADLNITHFQGRKLKVADLRAACEALPFLADKRLVIVFDALKHLRAGQENEALRSYLPQVPPIVDLVFVEADAPDQRTSLYKVLHKHAEVRVFQTLEGEALQAWLHQRAERLGVKLASPAARALAERVGGDGWALWNELQKLAAYVGTGSTITPAVVNQLVDDETASNLFSFIDTLFGRQSSRRQTALHRLHELLAAGEPPIYILFMIARQVRLLLAVQSAGHVRVDELARKLGQRPFVIRKIQEQAQGFNAAELHTFHDQLVRLDHAIKTGQLDPAVALDLLVGELLLSRQASAISV